MMKEHTLSLVSGIGLCQILTKVSTLPKTSHLHACMQNVSLLLALATEAHSVLYLGECVAI